MFKTHHGIYFVTMSLLMHPLNTAPNHSGPPGQTLHGGVAPDALCAANRSCYTIVSNLLLNLVVSQLAALV